MSTATIPGDELNGRSSPVETSGFQPYVPDKAELPELTWPAVVMGSLLGIVFGASSLYLLLKVGMTVSASIPVAVLAITIFRGLSHGLRHPPGDDPGEQHRADGRLGRRVDRLRRRRRDAGPDAAGLRAGVDAGDARGRAGGIARHPDDDPAAAGVHRQAARRAALSRGHGLRQGADRRRAGGLQRPDGFPGFRGRVHLPDPDAGDQVLGQRVAEGDHRASPATTRPWCRSSRRRRCWASATSSGRGSPR